MLLILLTPIYFQRMKKDPSEKTLKICWNPRGNFTDLSSFRLFKI